MPLNPTSNRKLDALRDRAASRVIWGQTDEDVSEFLRKEGVSPEMADQFLDAANREKAGVIRTRSFIKFVAGLIGAVICGSSLVYFEFTGVRYPGVGYFKLLILLSIGFIVTGGFALKNGLALLTGKTKGSAMDD